MNSTLANGAVANGASAPTFISAEASINASCSVSVGLIGFIKPGSAAPSGSLSTTVTSIIVHAAAAAVSPAGNLFPAGTKTSALSADIQISAELVAFILRDVFASADVDVSANIVAIPAEELGESSPAAYLTVTADATRTQHAVAFPAGTASIPDVSVTRTPRPEATILAFTTVRVEAGVNDVYDAFADIRGSANFALDNGLTLNGKTVTAIISCTGTANLTADPGRIRPGSAAPQGRLSLQVLATQDIDGGTVAASTALTLTAVGTRTVDAEATASVRVSINMAEPKMVRSGTIAFSTSAELSAVPFATLFGVCPVGGSVAASLEEAVRTLFAEAAVTGSGGSTLDIVNLITQGAASPAACSAEIVATGTREVFPDAEVEPVSADMVPQGTVIQLPQVEPIVVVSSVPAAVAGKITFGTALAQSTGECTIGGLGDVIITRLANTNFGGTLSIVAIQAVNAESYDPLYRTFFRPPYTSEFIRPAQDFEFRRVA